MMTLLVPVLALLGGAVGGEVLRGEAGGAEAGSADPAGEGYSASAQKGEGEETGAASFKFPEQFFVPLVRNGSVQGMMVLSLSVEMPQGTEEKVYARENQMRDALLRELLIYANSGGFDGNFTGEARQELLRSELLGSLRPVSPDVERVLIGDIAWQQA